MTRAGLTLEKSGPATLVYTGNKPQLLFTVDAVVRLQDQGHQWTAVLPDGSARPAVSPEFSLSLSAGKPISRAIASASTMNSSLKLANSGKTGNPWRRCFISPPPGRISPVPAPATSSRPAKEVGQTRDSRSALRSTAFCGSRWPFHSGSGPLPRLRRRSSAGLGNHLGPSAGRWQRLRRWRRAALEGHRHRHVHPGPPGRAEPGLVLFPAKMRPNAPRHRIPRRGIRDQRPRTKAASTAGTDCCPRIRRRRLGGVRSEFTNTLWALAWLESRRRRPRGEVAHGRPRLAPGELTDSALRTGAMPSTEMRRHRTPGSTTCPC